MNQELNELYPYWDSSTLVESVYNAAYNDRWFHAECMIDRAVIQQYLGWDIISRILKILHQFDRDDLAEGIFKKYKSPTAYEDITPVAVFYMWVYNLNEKRAALEMILNKHINALTPLIGYMSAEMIEYGRIYVQNRKGYQDSNIYYYLNRIGGNISFIGYQPPMESGILSYDRRTYYQISHTQDPDIPILHPVFSLSDAMTLAKRIHF